MNLSTNTYMVKNNCEYLLANFIYEDKVSWVARQKEQWTFQRSASYSSLLTIDIFIMSVNFELNSLVSKCHFYTYYPEKKCSFMQNKCL